MTQVIGSEFIDEFNVYDLSPEEFGELLATDWANAIRAVLVEFGILAYTHDRQQIRYRPRPTAPAPNSQTRRGRRNGYRNRKGVYIERKGN